MEDKLSRLGRLEDRLGWRIGWRIGWVGWIGWRIGWGALNLP